MALHKNHSLTLQKTILSGNSANNNNNNNDARTAYYKSKYASETVANALRPSPSASSDTTSNNEFPNSVQSAEYSTSASYSVGSYGDRNPPPNHRPEGSTSSANSGNDYLSSSRPSNTVYGGYNSNQGVIEYPQRPSAYSHRLVKNTDTILHFFSSQ